MRRECTLAAKSTRGASLDLRLARLPPPIHMVGTLSHNLPELETIIADCLARGRRHFVDVVESSPAKCRRVLETLGGAISYMLKPWPARPATVGSGTGAVVSRLLLAVFVTRK